MTIKTIGEHYQHPAHAFEQARRHAKTSWEHAFIASLTDRYRLHGESLTLNHIDHRHLQQLIDRAPDIECPDALEETRANQ